MTTSWLNSPPRKRLGDESVLVDKTEIIRTNVRRRCRRSILPYDDEHMEVSSSPLPFYDFHKNNARKKSAKEHQSTDLNAQMSDSYSCCCTHCNRVTGNQTCLPYSVFGLRAPPIIDKHRFVAFFKKSNAHPYRHRRNGPFRDEEQRQQQELDNDLNRVTNIALTFAKAHALIFVAYTIVFYFALRRHWSGLRQSIYESFVHNNYFEETFITSDAFDDIHTGSSGISSKVQAFLSLVIPHALNNIRSAAVSLEQAVYMALLWTAFLFLSSLALYKAATRILHHRRQMKLQQTKVCPPRLVWRLGWVRLGMTLIVLFEMVIQAVGWSWWLMGIGCTYKIPSFPLQLWPEAIFSVLASKRALHGPSWHTLDIAGLQFHSNRPLTPIQNQFLDNTQSFTSFHGIQALQQIQTGSIYLNIFQRITWVLHTVFIRVRNSSIPYNYLIGLFLFALVCDGISMMWKLKALYRHRYPLLRTSPTIRLFKRVFVAPCGFVLVSVALGQLYLSRYPSCTMEDRLFEPNRRYSPSAAIEPSYLYYSIGVPVPSSNFTTHLDIYLSKKTVSEWLGNNSAGWSTFFSATRYNRRMTLRWPFSAFHIWGQNKGENGIAITTWPVTRGLLMHDVPVVVADVRGSGSAGGYRLIDLDDVEIHELKAAAVWVKRQFWSNGVVAAGGVSYDGMSGIKLAALQDSPVDLLAGLYTPLKPVTDLVQSNGLQCTSFVEDYTSLVKAFERDGNPLNHFMFSKTSIIPIHVLLGFMFAFRLPQPPKGLEETFGPEQLRMREKNWNMKESVEQRQFVDDVLYLRDGRIVHVANGGIANEEFQSLINRKIPTYWTGAFCDSTGVNSLMEFYERLNHKESHHVIIVGPWGHGGRRGCEGRDVRTGTFSCGETDVYGDLSNFVLNSGRQFSEKWVYIDGARGCWSHHLIDETLSDLKNTTVWKTDTSTCIQKETRTITPRHQQTDTDSLVWVLTEGSEQLTDDSNKKKWRALFDETMSLIGPHHGLRVDYVKHLIQADARGLANDFVDLAMVYGARFNLFVCVLSRGLREFFRRAPVRIEGVPVRGWKQSAADIGKVYLRDISSLPPEESSPPEVEEKEKNKDQKNHKRRSLFLKERILDEKHPKFKWMNVITKSHSLTTSGKLSRWMIVQHLIRTPTDTDHAIVTVRNFQNIFARKSSVPSSVFKRSKSQSTTGAGIHAEMPSISINTEEIEEDVILFGRPVISIPFLFVKEDFADKSSVYDLALVAQLEEIFIHDIPGAIAKTHFLTEGRALLSAKTLDSGADAVIFDLSSKKELLQTLMRPRSRESLGAHRSLRREDSRFISEYFQNSTSKVAAVLTEITLQMEFISHKLSRGSKLKLTLSGQDHINFPWRTAEHRFREYYKNHSTSYMGADSLENDENGQKSTYGGRGRSKRPLPKLKKLETWRIPLLDVQDDHRNPPVRGTAILEVPLLIHNMN